MKIRRKIARKTMRELCPRGGDILLAGAFALGSLLLPGMAEAADNQEKIDAYSLDEIVVTAQRTGRSEIDTPASTTIITAEEIENSGYRNAYEAIEQQLGVTSESYGETGTDFGGSFGRITLRGYDKGTLVLVNGVPMNQKNYGSLESIPNKMIDRIEIIKGAASTLYGANAMGGVINVILKKPQAGDNEGSIAVTGGNIFKKVETFYMGDRFMVDISRDWSKDIPHQNVFDLKSVSDTDWWVGAGQRNRAAVAINITDELSLHYNYTSRSISRGGPKYKRNGDVTTNYDYDYDDTRQTVNLSYEGKTNGLKAILGYNYRKAISGGYSIATNPDGSPKAGSKPSYPGDYRLGNTIFDLQKTWEIGKDKLIVGYTYFHDNVQNDTYTYKNNAKQKSASYDTVRTTNALYVSYSKQVNDRLNLTFGLRGEDIHDPINGQQILLPQFQSNYKFDKDTAWFVNIGRAFQMPDVGSTASMTVDASDVKPESGWTYETGIKLRRGDNTWKASVYYMDMKDKLGWLPKDPAGIQHPFNVGNFSNFGVEVEYARKLSDAWKIRVGGSVSNPKIRDLSPNASKSYQSHASSGLAAMVALDYHMEKWTGNLNFKYLGDRQPSYYFDQGDVYDVPDKITLNLNVKYKFGKNHELTLGVYNLLNRDNWANNYGYLEPGINYRLTYEFTF